MKIKIFQIIDTSGHIPASTRTRQSMVTHKGYTPGIISHTMHLGLRIKRGAMELSMVDLLFQE